MVINKKSSDQSTDFNKLRLGFIRAEYVYQDEASKALTPSRLLKGSRDTEVFEATKVTSDDGPKDPGNKVIWRPGHNEAEEGNERRIVLQGL